MRRLIIAIDCDDVLMESTPFLVTAYNEKFKTRVTLERAHESGNEQWGVTDSSVVLSRLSDLQLSDAYLAMKPITDAIRVVNELAEAHELHLVTARDGRLEAATCKTLDTFFPNAFKTIEHVGSQRSKGEVCRSIGADILIDDNAKHLFSALEYGLTRGGALHFGDYLWNVQLEVQPELTRCPDWNAIQREINHIAK